ncbi:class I SAM-dependent methyltransferase [Microvirga sp. M2]|uniref:class I SAM-dependent methyltransferase n=1 Tax=Microvirga sp. M2 TaxID=3073270 RepID=UPI0039C0FDAD
MDPASFSLLWEVETTHFWFQARSRLLTGLIDRYFPEAKSFLEIGCGNAAVLSAVAKGRDWQRLAGSELHPSALGFARQRLGTSAELVQMDAREIPAQDAFEIVGAFDVLEHIEEDVDVLKQMHAVTSPGGGIIVSVPQHQFLWSTNDDIAHHVRRYRRGELEAKMKAAGFNVLFSTSFAAFILPAFVISRLLSRIRQDGTDEIIKREYRISGWANHLLGTVTGIEVNLALHGLAWPMGGSRVVVAKKPA